MPFRVTGLDPAPFRSLFDLDEAELARRNIVRVFADTPYSAPCRISLQDAEVGEELLLLRYDHQPAASPFRASGPIFVRRSATAAYEGDDLPAALRRRTLSAPAYDAAAMMIEADLVDGAEADRLIEAWFERPEVQVVHLHYAKRGCFAAEVRRRGG
jgi:hypothetical protein